MRIDLLRPALPVLLLAATVPAPAQTARPMLDYATAAKMRDACLAYAKTNKFEVAIAVFDDSARLIAFARMDGVSTVVGDLAQWKGKSAATYRIASAETAKWNSPGAPAIATFGGGQPFFMADGTPLGGVGVSGAVTDQDLACGRAAIAAGGRKGAPEQK
jgi:uncharacterized protein GlcG (DUF336 family)